MTDGKYVASGDLRLWTERFGDSGDPAVLLIMGTSAPGAGWPDDMVETLVGAGRQVIRFDHRDTGRSTCVTFATRPYTLADMAADAVAVLDGLGIAAAHVVGASLGGAIGQWLAAHRPERVLTLTAIMSGPMGQSAGPAWARAMAGQEPDPGDLPPPTPEFLHHLVRRATTPPTTRDEHVAANVETWRVLNGDVLPFDEQAARRFVETAHDQAADPAAATNHDLASRRMTEDRLVPLSSITAPTLVVHGTEDPLRPLPHGRAVAAQIPNARLRTIPGMGHGFFSPGLPRRIAEPILEHTASRAGRSSVEQGHPSAADRIVGP
ncbi:alpha/beta fold hydrolase [Streptosporangium lutulentum]|uniref:Pimeloyl-ACP methyl ester carboxylesterase n=1 Tax=Streptosporangium lutulentum TaxID=1461250 RepID=A0ABT9QK13_9ACTN|nr:alpha/beta hydrolase [Streptosporangium lutulentum]MDP9847049.1 pimeloyl-ACP methyl ester carboxylesterase [Streptosporangium lutulentum]